MQIKVLADSNAVDKRFSIGWGVSFLAGKKVLFDTGEKGNVLLNNMQLMDVPAGNIKAVVLSHDHWDHTGGLWSLLEQNREIKVYACPNFSSEFKEKVRSAGAELIEASRFTQIAEDIYTTGEIAGVYAGKYMAEQSLVIKAERGLVILTGCAHPGIITILEKVKENLDENIRLVMGGFHLMGKERRLISLIVGKFRQFKVARAAPTHCSGKDAEELFQEEYQENFVPIKAGMVIEDT
ncbi:MAG: MBL fold metallo-hydrolase [bacterium]|nr:MBL fold metallo-hydrolase [bacterium]